jgi:hypothetical protein
VVTRDARPYPDRRLAPSQRVAPASVAAVTRPAADAPPPTRAAASQIIELQRTFGNAAVTALLDQQATRQPADPGLRPPARSAPRPSGHPPVLQRTLELEIDKTDVIKGMSAEQAYQAIRSGLEKFGDQRDPLLLNWRSKPKKDPIVQVLGEWISAPKADLKNTEPARHALSRHYGSYRDIASAVLDRVRSLPGIVIEENLARAIRLDETVQRRLVTFISEKLTPWLDTARSAYGETLRSLDKTTKELESVKRLYLPYLEAGERSIAMILAAPTAESISILISAIHDLAEILYHPAAGEAAAKDVVEVPEDKLQGLVIVDDEPGQPTADAVPGQQAELVTPEFERRPLGDYRGQSATPLQSNAQVATAGKLGYPVSLGPSRTTGKLMMLAQATGATPEMKEAIAWAIFSLWYTDYRRDLTDIHRYHFVMDMASVFGVPYDPVGAPRRPSGGDYTDLINTSLKEARNKARTVVTVEPAPAAAAPAKRQPATTRSARKPTAPLELTEHQLAVLRRFAPGRTVIKLPVEYTDTDTLAQFGLGKADFDAAWLPLWNHGKNSLVRPKKGEGLELTTKGTALLGTLATA